MMYPPVSAITAGKIGKVHCLLSFLSNSNRGLLNNSYSVYIVSAVNTGKQERRVSKRQATAAWGCIARTPKVTGYLFGSTLETGYLLETGYTSTDDLSVV